jgi:hypothetical protein
VDLLRHGDSLEAMVNKAKFAARRGALAVRGALRRATRQPETLGTVREGIRYAHGLPAQTGPASDGSDGNPLEAYFDSVTEGPGIWKWRHYFPIYHRHLGKFCGRSPQVVEIGIYSGGSLPMWLDYFGEGALVYGVDIAPECVKHEREGVRVFIGDQADPSFWERFHAEVPQVDVVIDDGGHQAHQQITTLECLLPHLTPGGVYICEDIHGIEHSTHGFIDGLARTLSDIRGGDIDPLPVHQQIASIHRYPLLTVIEKPDRRVERFTGEKRGTVWEPGIY